MSPDPPDRLAEYDRRRDRAHTPEPFGAGGPDPPAPGRPRFVIHRHLARRLHYDLRLERDGVLVSFAVPRGLPWDPGSRNLAVHVEDHPLDYIAFQGEIPAGQYGAGRVQVWDTGTYELLEDKPDGGMSVRLAGARARGTWELVPAGMGGDPKNWLVIRKPEPGLRPVSDAHPAPMLAVQVQEPPAGAGWVHEVKWDGFRCLARLHAAEATLWSRNDQDLTERFAAVAKRLPRALRATECVVDGEVCALDGGGTPRFGLLQRGAGTLIHQVFDLLEIDGLDVTALPWGDRRALLEPLVEPDDPVVSLSPVFDDGAALMRLARERELEGIIAKRRDSPYLPGRRSDAWRKVKVRHRDIFAIAGHRPGTGSRADLGALVLAREATDGWEWAGNCGSGLGEDGIAALLAALAPLRRGASPLARVPPELARPREGVVWADPVLRCEVEYTEVTDEGRLRAPVFIRLLDAADTSAEGGPAGAEVAASEEPGDEAGAEARVRVTRADKVYFPAEGITKGDLIAYYRSVSPALVPHLRDRPMTMMRMPHGIEGKHFVQKNRPPHMPDWIPTAALPGGTSRNARIIDFALINEPDAVAWLVNAGCVDMNPWYSRAGSPTHPDWLLFDLDPSEGTGFPEAARVAL
ncbi:MAG: non-homologous end-joining DNA ligase, partial [Miltoncostaeaceae bacterium]